MFCIAEFESHFGSKKEIAVVHSSWFQSEQKCFWPPFWKIKAKLVSAIKSGAKPDSSTWALYDAVKAKNWNFDSYESAHRNLMAYEEKSELSSEENSGRLRKRRHRGKEDIDDESSSSESTVSQDRSRKRSDYGKNERNRFTQPGLGPPPILPSYVMDNDTSVQPTLVAVSNIVGNEVPTSSATPRGTRQPSIFIPLNETTENTDSNRQNYNIVQNSQLFVSPQQTSSFRQEKTPDVARADSSIIIHGVSPSPTSRHPIYSLSGTTTNDQTGGEDFVETLRRIESNQEILSLKLDNAMNMLRTLVIAKNLPQTGRPLTQIRLPLTTVDEFKAMHESLRNNRELQEDLVTMLASKGGNNPNQIAHLITRSLMTDELMLSFTMKGQTGKEAFKDFIFLDCIYDAVRRQPKGSVSTDFEIKKAVEYWLKRAAKRINERNKRQTGIQPSAGSPAVPP